MIHSLQKLTVQYSCFLTDLLHFLELHIINAHGQKKNIQIPNQKLQTKMKR